MITEIKTRKVILKGPTGYVKSRGIHREILKIDNVEPFENLPKEYTSNGPAYWLENERRIKIKTKAGKETSMTVAEIMREEHFQAILKILKEAGERYTVINREYKKWNGDETITI